MMGLGEECAGWRKVGWKALRGGVLRTEWTCMRCGVTVTEDGVGPPQVDRHAHEPIVVTEVRPA